MKPQLRTTEVLSAPPHVGVLLAAFNGADFLVEQLDSILTQVGVRVTVFVSVDLSSDGTLSLLAEAARVDDRVILLPVGQRFGGAAPNFLRMLRDVEVCVPDFVAFADQDDIWSPDKLARAIEVLRAAQADGYSSNVTAFWPSGRRMLVDKSQPQRAYDYFFEAAGPGCTYVLARSLAIALQAAARDQTQLLSGLVYHDWLTYAFARANGRRWVIDPQPHMLYRQHGTNQIGVNMGWTSAWRRARQLLDGHGFVQAQRVMKAVGAWDSEFVCHSMRRGRVGLLWLALHVGQCRRRRRDRWLMAILCLLMACRSPASWSRP